MGMFNKTDASSKWETNYNDLSNNAGTDSQALSGQGNSVRILGGAATPSVDGTTSLTGTVQKLALLAAAGFGVFILLRFIRGKSK